MDSKYVKEDYYVEFPEKQNKIVSELFFWVQQFCLGILVICVAFSLFAKPVIVNGDSMNPTLHSKDTILITANTFSLKRGDIVVVTQPWERDESIVKRVIGLPGDTININFETGEVFINGKLIKEDYILEPTRLYYDAKMPITIPDGYLFVMGDNRNGSLDSRSGKIGLIRKQYVFGKAFFRVRPDTGSLIYKENGNG